MPDYAARRTTMVDTQVRPSDVTKFPIIAAMLAVPREAFVPAAMREVAYAGEDLVVAPGRVLLAPRSLAKMLDALDVQPGELVLDIGALRGYSSAVIARLAEAVVAVEELDDQAAEAESVLAACGADNVAVIKAPLADGAPQHGPYDVVIVQGGVETVPQAILDQVKDGGRMACIFMEAGLGTCRLGFKQGDRMDWRYAFNATAPVLPGFVKTPVFGL